MAGFTAHRAAAAPVAHWIRELAQTAQRPELDQFPARTSGFVSSRPVYAPGRTASRAGRMIRLQIEDGDAGKLDLVLGQAS